MDYLKADDVKDLISDCIEIVGKADVSDDFSEGGINALRSLLGAIDILVMESRVIIVTEGVTDGPVEDV